MLRHRNFARFFLFDSNEKEATVNHCNKISATTCIVVFTTLVFLSLSDVAIAQSHHLTGWAALPSTVREPGPISGQFIGGRNGVTTPFDSQPVPGWSGILNNTDGTFLALPDNGYGSQSNSPDFLLRWYNITPDFKTADDGTTQPGLIVDNSFVTLNDKNGVLKDGRGIDFEIIADMANYPGHSIPVPQDIKDNRYLTGADFDVESFSRAADGTIWIGEEFGPLLMHVDSDGALLEDPIPHPTLISPFDPLGRSPSTLRSGRGFESMAFSAEGTKLYVMPETAPNGSADETLIPLYEFDTSSKTYTGNDFTYRREGQTRGNSILLGDMTHVAADKYIAVERDNDEGPSARLKKVFLFDLNVVDSSGVLVKRELIDLLNIPDPNNIGGLGNGLFSLPIQSVEAVVMVDEFTVGVAVDSNYPAGNGRTQGVPDDSEFILVRFDRSVGSIVVPEPASVVILILGVIGVLLLQRIQHKTPR